MNNRDKKILAMLKHFQVMSRRQLERLICPEVANPTTTINRIMKRLSRDGHVKAIPQPIGNPHLYCLSPPTINPHSTQIPHRLGMVDVYLGLGCPRVFNVEPMIGTYNPDIYTEVNGKRICIELQLSYINEKRRQKQVSDFIKAYPIHNAKTLLIFTDLRYDVKVPKGFEVITSNLEAIKLG